MSPNGEQLTDGQVAVPNTTSGKVVGRSSTATKSRVKKARFDTIAKSPRGLFDHIQPENARRLLLAAITAFSAHGYHATTTREIATIAGLSPAALYTHYPTKEDLIYEICLVGHDYIYGLTKAASEESDDPVEQIARMVRASVMYHSEEYVLARVVNAEFRGALNKRRLATIVQKRHESSELVRSVLQAGADADQLIIDNMHGTTIAMLRLMDVSAWFNPSGEMSPAELADVFVALVLRMVGGVPATDGTATADANSKAAASNGKARPAAKTTARARRS